ncbi:hypothetical protein [Saccharopolyspora phatthalungensis]|uniref:Uncharacterized protein n=1 Tax=Saccharopolyspora phatthalungensis TaxID=664693 RepID=A0A840QC13_9PSEU|nr:hypothetical protein [Saccharopolyspora phatthalungensis]MBB5156089.1 hypothetical protein [Saccharopolyspora phatthalungensis]
MSRDAIPAGAPGPPLLRGPGNPELIAADLPPGADLEDVGLLYAEPIDEAERSADAFAAPEVLDHPPLPDTHDICPSSRPDRARLNEPGSAADRVAGP